jgi:hypothetical protein
MFTHNTIFNLNLLKVGSIDSLQIINWLFFGFIIFVITVIGVRNYMTKKKVIETRPTWGCAYGLSVNRFQYTANSFVRSYSKLAKPVLDIEKKDVEINEVFPAGKHYETDPYDKIERFFIDKPLKLLSRISDLFLFLQNGHLQRYILYGIIFITAVLGIPLVIEKIVTIIHFLNNL